MAAINSLKTFVQQFTRDAQLGAGQRLQASLNPVVYQSVEETGGLLLRSYPFFVFQDNRRIWDWSRQTTVIHTAVATPQTQEEKKEEKDEANAQWAAVAGTAAAIVGAALLGFFYASYKTQTESDEAANNACSRALEIEPPEIKESFSQLLSLQNKVNSTFRSKIQISLGATALFLASSMTLAVGGLSTLPVWILAGKIGILASTTLFVFNVANHWNDDKALEKTDQEIMVCADRVLGATFYYDADLKNTQPVDSRVGPPTYESLFSVPTAPAHTS